MSDSPSQTPQRVPSQTPAQVLVPADELSRLWQSGETPDLEVFLAQSEPLAPAELAAVLRVDQRQRWELGQQIKCLEKTVGRRYPTALALAADLERFLNGF